MFFDERTKRSLSISDVSEKTFINIKYLNAIESGDYSDFPSEGFARAYFIKYANFLSLKCDFPAIYATKNRKEEIVKNWNEISPLAAAGPRPLGASQSYNTLHSPLHWTFGLLTIVGPFSALARM